ncbi:ATP-dependent RNA helicase RhlB [Dasania marina]|uniref:ATP-dependent RNA helicase RhlB n=1 Tax=Dasania marina TaxID=471499 RepID=UPI00036D1D46
MLGKLFGKKNKAEVTSSAPQAKKADKKPHGRGKHQQSKKAKPQQPAWTVDQFKVPVLDGKARFHDLGIDDRLMHGIADLGFEYPSAIQAASLPHTLQGHDVIGKAQTGTGKTAAFLITIINDLLNNPIEGERFAGEPRAVIIAPTRELVVQIADDARGLLKHTDINVVTLIGGADYQKQQQQLQNNCVDIVVASPGRLIDFMQRGDLYLDQIEVLVIDEADRMLDMGFIPQVRRIVRSTPRKEDRQTLLFSATFTPEVLSLTEQWTFNPITIEIEPESVATDSVEQKVFIVAAQDKYRLLKNIVTDDSVESVIVFANRRDQVRKLSERLQKAGVKCGMLSGEVPQNKRTSTLQNFKDGKLKVLIATDVAGRGIHVKGISHVVNYTLPEDPEDYVHRIGRTGRAGAKGTSISFACEDDAFLLPTIEELLGDKLKCEQPPEELLR